MTHVSIRMGLSTLMPVWGASSIPPSPKMADAAILRGWVDDNDLVLLSWFGRAAADLCSGAGRRVNEARDRAAGNAVADARSRSG